MTVWGARVYSELWVPGSLTKYFPSCKDNIFLRSRISSLKGSGYLSFTNMFIWNVQCTDRMKIRLRRSVWDSYNCSNLGKNPSISLGKKKTGKLTYHGIHDFYAILLFYPLGR